MTCGIYKITSPSGKIYIGQSVDIERRFSEYRRKGSAKKQRRLFNSFVAHGIDKHVFEVVELCAVEHLSDRERHWQEAFDCAGKTGLNCRLTNSSDRSGKHSQESIAIMRVRQAGENNPNYGKRGAQTSTFGRKRPDSERAAIKAFQATRGKIIQQICAVTGVVLREAKARDYAADGYSQGNISSCCSGRLKTHKGFAFKYKDTECNT